MKTEYIKKWVENALTRTKNVNSNAPSSYGLKHLCEDSIGVYVSNQEIIDVMTELGFKKKKVTVNYDFNISKIVNKVLFKNKLGSCYSCNYRVFNTKSKTIQL
jgi:hypothetical protein